MFDNVIEWFLSRAGDRRQYYRRAGAFPVRWGEHQGVGGDISPNGVMFLLSQAIPTSDYDLTLHLGEREIRVRVKHVRKDQVEHQGRKLNRYMGEFSGITADDWDAIAAYVNEEPSATNRRQMQNQPMTERVDDAYGLLPAVLQKKIVAALVTAGRLEEPHSGELPLVKVFYGGLTRLAGVGVAHRFNAHSRVRKGEAMMAYDTRFLIAENGELTSNLSV